MTKIYTLYDTPVHSGVTFDTPTMTQQHFKDDCDVNLIIARFAKTGILPQITSNFEFADVSSIPSYQDAMHYIMEAQNRFMELPAKVRKEFDNDPGAFLAFLENPNNYDRAIELGLIERQPAPPNPQRDTPTNVPAADAAAQQAASDQSST